MMPTNHPHHRPKVAIIDANTLAMMGLKHILQNIMPFMQVDTFNSFEMLQANAPDQYFHFFVSTDILLLNRSFFIEHKFKTIVLGNSTVPSTNLSHFHSINVTLPEDALVKSILQLEQHAHGQGQHLPPMPKCHKASPLTEREIEVLSLIVTGKLNKEIASQLNIGLTTVITHRKNIMEKLGVKSVSALTIYAVMNGYVDINRI